MIEYTAIKHSDNQLVITMNNNCKELLNNIDFDFEIINKVWYAHDGYETMGYPFEPPLAFGDIDYEVTLQFKSEYDREFFDYIFDKHCTNVDKLEYSYKTLEVAV